MDIKNENFTNADISKITGPNFFGQRALESQMNTECPQRDMNDRNLLLTFAEFLCRYHPKEDYLTSLLSAILIIGAGLHINGTAVRESERRSPAIYIIILYAVRDILRR